MTLQEAIEQLRFDQSMILFDPTTGEEHTLKDVKLFNEENYKTYLADELAISALEKQIPKKPTEINKCPRCSVCGIFLDVIFVGYYCPNCGQAVDWSDEK